MTAMNTKRWCFFRVKWTQPCPAWASALPLQAYILPNDFNNVELTFEMLSEVHRDEISQVELCFGGVT